ncbi:MAG: proline dehydrogenase family protein [Bdellovibrionales bacterium]|nr:proline dehydrogenase family protein [Bdellovibrionales bacterium]
MDPNNHKIIKKGEDIFQSLGGSGKSIFNKDWWYGKIMDWSMKNADFKTQMFRFVDVLPTLSSGKEVSKHLKEYFAEKDGKLPPIFNFGLGMGALAPNLMAGTIKKNVTEMAKLFITGEDPREALNKLKQARNKNMAFTVDILGEACLSDAEADDYNNRYLELIDWLVKDCKDWQENNLTDRDHLGEIPKVNVSVKLTALYSQIHPEAWEHSKKKVKEKLRAIFDKAIENFVFINIDMEKYEVKDLTIEVFQELLMEVPYKSYRHFGIVMQAYLRDSYKDCERMTEFAKTRGTPFSIRLVKGAYWDYETIGALQKGWPIPVYSNKQESDANYEACTRLLLENHQHISLAVASHNVRSIAHAIVIASDLGLPKNAIEIQMLYGMADAIKKSLIDDGYRLREYCPVGDLIPGMSYLVRRLLENTSNQSFLKSKFADESENSTLLQDPKDNLKPTPSVPNKSEELFYNEPIQNYSLAEPRKKLSEAIAQFKKEVAGNTLKSHIDGKMVSSDRTLENINPSTGESLGHTEMGNVDMAEASMEAAKVAFAQWKDVPALQRADLLDKVADIMARDRFQIMACEILEAGKTWKEADGDVCEAIDFCRYYAKDMRRLAPGRRVGHSPGEFSHYHYIPRGVNVVIAPWNFPLAILTGMVAASVVTGNTVVMKPAEQTPLTANFLMKAFVEAGAPQGVLNMLFGYGEEVGAYLVNHKDTAMICFTGSKAVGLHILEQAAKVQPGQTHIKKCITELGGKNAIIVDSDADLDEAVAGVIYSAFGFQGQKCSACSRVLVHEECYDRFVDRLVETAKSLHIGPAESPDSTIGPVIDKEAQDKILSYIEIGKQEGTLAYQAETPDQGYYVGPTIFTGIEAHHRLANEEIFGPVLAVMKVSSFEEALRVANDTEYALTGAIYSRSPAHIDEARKNVMVGNFYINRGSTAALVDRHPFGGFKMSGAGSKTGGPDYLIQFMDPRVTTENTLRRGFSPDLPN